MRPRYRPRISIAKKIPRRRALARLVQACLILPPFPASAGDKPPPPARLPAFDLLLCRDRSGNPRPVRTRADWRRRRAEILRGFEAVTGPFPCSIRTTPRWETLEETDCGDHLRRNIVYEPEPGSRTPAYLLLPQKALAGRRCPAALCLHQTHPAGRKVVVGLGNSPDDEYALELVRRGYVCLAPPYPLLADYTPDLAALGYASGTLKAVWDNIRGIDLLEALGCVDRRRILAIGHSLGGHNAIFTATLDPRIRGVVTSCAFDAFPDYMNGNLTGWTQTRYLPRLKDYLGRSADVPFDFPELLGALAPRAVFVSAPFADTNFRWQSVARIAQAVEPVYALHGARDRLRVVHPDAGHQFPPITRQQAYAFIDDQFPHRP